MGGTLWVQHIHVRCLTDLPVKIFWVGIIIEVGLQRGFLACARSAPDTAPGKFFQERYLDAIDGCDLN